MSPQLLSPSQIKLDEMQLPVLAHWNWSSLHATHRKHLPCTTASLPLLLADDDYDRQTSPRVRFPELAQVWAIAHSLLLDRVCGTTYLSIYVTLNILSWSSAGY